MFKDHHLKSTLKEKQRAMKVRTTVFKTLIKTPRPDCSSHIFRSLRTPRNVIQNAGKIPADHFTSHSPAPAQIHTLGKETEEGSQLWRSDVKSSAKNHFREYRNITLAIIPQTARENGRRTLPLFIATTIPACYRYAPKMPSPIPILMESKEIEGKNHANERIRRVLERQPAVFHLPETMRPFRQKKNHNDRQRQEYHKRNSAYSMVENGDEGIIVE